MKPYQRYINERTHRQWKAKSPRYRRIIEQARAVISGSWQRKSRSWFKLRAAATKSPYRRA